MRSAHLSIVINEQDDAYECEFFLSFIFWRCNFARVGERADLTASVGVFTSVCVNYLVHLYGDVLP